MPIPFAFQFLSPFFGSWWATALTALGAASVPVIIHLLNKRRFREVEWAAMKYLLAALKKNARRIRIEQLLLLLCRMTILAILVLALAQPSIEELGLRAAVVGRTHKIIVLDVTASMQHTSGDRMRLARAQEVARRIILNESHQGDSVSVVLLASRDQILVGGASYNRRAVADEIDRLALRDERGDLQATLSAVRQVIRASEGVSRREVYFLSDLQRATWLPETGSRAAVGQFHDLVREIGHDAELIVVDLGEAESENLAITGIAVRDPLVLRDQRVQIEATVRNFGRTDRRGVAAQLYVGDREMARRTLDVAAGSESTVVFTHTFAVPGPQAVEVRLDDDVLAVDNRRWLAVEVRPEVRVLAIGGQPRAGQRRDDTFYLERALEARPGNAEPYVTVDVQNQTVLLRSDFDLGRYDAIFLCNVGRFTASEAARLEAYLEQGGGIVWFLGDKVDADNYNQVLHDDGEGVLPVRLGVVRGDPQQEQFVRLHVEDYAHPILRPWEGQVEALDRVLTFEYFATEVPAGSPARVVMRFEDSTPALLEWSRDGGRGLLVTTSADDSWSTFAPWGHAFVPTVHRMLQYCIAGGQEQRNQLVGEPLTRTLPTLGQDVTAVVLTPVRRYAAPSEGAEQPFEGAAEAEHREDVPLTARVPASVFVYDNTSLAGVYRVRYLGRDDGAGRPEAASPDLFAVNVDPAESDPARLEREDLASQVFPATAFQYLTHLRETEAGEEATVRSEQSGHRLLLWALLGLLGTELFMAWRFGHHAPQAKAA